MKLFNTESDIVLPSNGKLRGRRHESLGKSEIYAIVRNGKTSNGSYDFPSVTLASDTAFSWSDADGKPYVEGKEHVTFRFQRNTLRTMNEFDTLIEDYIPGNRCYGMHCEFDLHWASDLDRARALLDLVGRARDAVTELRKESPDSQLLADMDVQKCELRALVASLRLIGIPVVVRGGKAVADLQAATAESAAA